MFELLIFTDEGKDLKVLFVFKDQIGNKEGIFCFVEDIEVDWVDIIIDWGEN